MSENQKPQSGLTLLPCAPNVCQECATDHDPALPHNAQSLYYQYRFYGAHGRWPNWNDATEHCEPELREAWMQGLRDLGVDVDAGRVNTTQQEGV